MRTHTLTFGQQHTYRNVVNVGCPKWWRWWCWWKWVTIFQPESWIRPSIFCYLLTLSGWIQMHECVFNEFIARAGRFVMVLLHGTNVLNQSTWTTGWCQRNAVQGRSSATYIVQINWLNLAQNVQSMHTVQSHIKFDLKTCSPHLKGQKTFKSNSNGKIGNGRIKDG